MAELQQWYNFSKIITMVKQTERTNRFLFKKSKIVFFYFSKLNFCKNLYEKKNFSRCRNWSRSWSRPHDPEPVKIGPAPQHWGQPNSFFKWCGATKAIGASAAIVFWLSLFIYLFFDPFYACFLNTVKHNFYISCHLQI